MAKKKVKQGGKRKGAGRKSYKSTVIDILKDTGKMIIISTISPVLDYENLNYFILGFIKAKKMA